MEFSTLSLILIFIPLIVLISIYIKDIYVIFDYLDLYDLNIMYNYR